MDCRKPLFVALWCVGGLAGCTTTHSTPTLSVSQPLTPGQLENIPLVKAVDPPKRPPHAETCVKFGDFAFEKSTWPEVSPVDTRELRETARKAYQQAIGIDPNCLSAYQGLARLYVAIKDYRHAIATYQEAQRHFPKEPSLFYELGMCYGQQKEWDSAVQNLTKAADLDPEKRLYNNILGYTLARAGRYDDSLKVFARLESEQEAHYRVAWMLKHLNETDLARQHVLTALQTDPQMEPALALLAELDGKPPQPGQQPPPTGEDVQQTNYTPEAPLPEAPPTPH